MSTDGSDPHRLTDNDVDDLDPHWSPDGARIAFHREKDGNVDVYVMDTDGGNQQRLTTLPGEDGEAVWRP